MSKPTGVAEAQCATMQYGNGNVVVQDVYSGKEYADKLAELYHRLEEKDALICRLLSCLKLIAEKPKPDGTWTHDREGCKHLADRALDLLLSKFGLFSCDPGPPGELGEPGIPS